MALCREKHFVKWSDNFRGGDIRIFSSEKDHCCGSVTYYGSGSTGTSYSYTYDENGNLKTISKNGTLLHEYTYDSLNQLTTWYDATADATTIYSYYKGGNLAKIFSNGDYYNKPWEITADIYGGVQSRYHTEEDIKAGFSYLGLSKRCGPFVWVSIN